MGGTHVPLQALPHILFHVKAAAEQSADFLQAEAHINDAIAILKGEVGHLGSERLSQLWFKVRNAVPLQVRLIAEQYFWDEGFGFLVTGFRPGQKRERTKRRIRGTERGP